MKKRIIITVILIIVVLSGVLLSILKRGNITLYDQNQNTWLEYSDNAKGYSLSYPKEFKISDDVGNVGIDFKRISIISNNAEIDSTGITFGYQIIKDEPEGAFEGQYIPNLYNKTLKVFPDIISTKIGEYSGFYLVRESGENIINGKRIKIDTVDYILYKSISDNQYVYINIVGIAKKGNIDEIQKLIELILPSMEFKLY